jgi:stearoyl-CoA desaturase (delta-9 desaturase)
MYMISAIGITIGYHRYFTHRAFQTHRAVEAILAIFGSMAFEGPVLKWVANHRCHHKHSDRPGDPHSPHEHGEGVVNMLKGMWHAHVGWIFNPDPENQAQYVPDLSSDRLLRWISQSWTVWAALGLVLPAFIGGIITLTWQGAVLGFLWGGLARVFLVHHVTWSVNSVCHIWGSRPFRSHDHSRNNFIFGVLALGEGWHNNHHAFPTSARHGLRWWQIDASWWMIKAASWVGLVWDVKVPSEQKQAMKSSKVTSAPASLVEMQAEV